MPIRQRPRIEPPHDWRQLSLLVEGLEQRVEPKEPKPMPFAATRRHDVWAVDIRYLDTPHLDGKAYCLSILDHFRRAKLASAEIQRHGGSVVCFPCLCDEEAGVG